MIDFEFKKPFDTHYEGVIKVSISHDADKFFMEEQLPIRILHKSLSGEVLWSSELTNGTWSSYSQLTHTTFDAIDSLGNNLIHWKWDAFEHGDVAHQIFENWATNNRGANGIAIGTHNGMTGEWVNPVNKGQLKATLIEASEKQFKDLINYYNDKEWITCKQELITTDGKDCEFFECLNTFTNSVYKEHALKYNNEITSVLMKSTSINEIFNETLTRGEIKWLHIDAEGLDDYLILSLHEYYLPEVIIFETESLPKERHKSLVKYLNSKNYIIIDCGRNVICKRKN